MRRATLIGLLFGLGWACLVLAAPARRDAGTLPAPAPDEPAPAGAFRWIKDSSGGAPKPNAVVILELGPAGSASLTASQPGDEWTSSGTYAAAGGFIDMSLPEIGWAGKHRPFSFKEGVLTLPFQVMSEKDGTSTWQPARIPALPGLRALNLFGEFLDRGLSGEEAQAETVAALRREFGPAGSRAPEGLAGPAAAPDGPIIEVDKDYRNIYLKFDDQGPSETAILRTFIDSPARVHEFPLKLHPIGADPRSQRPYKPVSSADNPKRLTAWILAPALNKYAFQYEGPVFTADGKITNVKVRGRTRSAKDCGVDPDYLKKVLVWAGYDPQSAYDGAVTVRQFVDALRAEPGLFLFSGHGGLTDRAERASLADPPRPMPIFQTGVPLLDYWQLFSPGDMQGSRDLPYFRDAVRRRMDEQVETVKELFPDLPPIGAERRYEILDRYFRNCWLKITNVTGVVWLAVTSDFLALVRKHYNLDFSRSLVVLSSCDSATTGEAALAMRARAFFGFSGTVNIEAAAQLEKFLLSAMARPTFSAREVYTRAFIVPSQRIQFYAEDRHLAWQTLAGMRGVVSLKAFGDEMAPPRPGSDEAKLGLMPYRPYSAAEFWLMFMNRWASDLDGGRQALERCFEAFWKPKKRPGLGETFCTQGVIGNHYPNEDEVAAATLAVTGKSKYRDKTDNGRFTLNDGPARASLNPPLPPEWGKPGGK